GLVDDFFQKNLAQYVDMSGAQWKWRATANDGTLGIPQATLDEFQRAATIRDAFFASGGRQASMRFDLKPVSLDPAIAKFTLDIDGRKAALELTASSVVNPFRRATLEQFRCVDKL